MAANEDQSLDNDFGPQLALLAAFSSMVDESGQPLAEVIQGQSELAITKTTGSDEDLFCGELPAGYWGNDHIVVTSAETTPPSSGGNSKQGTISPPLPGQLQLPQPPTQAGSFRLPAPVPVSAPVPVPAPQPESPSSQGTKRKAAPAAADAAERPVKANRRCVPKACTRCKSRKAKCLRDGDGDCTSCLKAGVPCVRENVDFREKTAVLAALEAKSAAYHKAYTAAACLVSKALQTVFQDDSGTSVLDAAIVSLTEKRNDSQGSLMENLPTISRCLACPEVTIDPLQIAPVPAVDVAAITKPQLKKHVDSFESAAGARIHSFRKAVIALMTPLLSWPQDLLDSRQDLMAGALEGTYGGSFDGMINWAATSEYAQRLFEENQARNN